MKIKRYWWVGIVFVAFLSIGALQFDKDYDSALYNDFSGGKNVFSDPANLQDNQATDIENLLFYGNRLRARKAVDSFNSNSLGNYSIDGVIVFKKQDFEETLVTYNGAVWVASDDSNEFTTFLKENIDSVARVKVTQNDSTITGVPDSTFFTQLGYDDSISIYLNGNLYYIYQILHDTLLYLYDPYTQDTDSTSLFNAPVTVPIDRPTIFDVWLNKLFIAGSRQVIAYDGALVDTSTSDTLTFTITDTARVDEVFKVKTDPTPSTAGYEPGDLEGYYVVGYNDEAGGGHTLNIPLRIDNNTASWIWITVDSSFVANTHHLDSASAFRIKPPFTSEYMVCEGIIDAVRNDADTTAYYIIYNIYDHSVFSGYDSTAFDFGYYYYKHMDSEEGEFETTCRFQSMGVGDSNYLYVACLKANMVNFPAVGDTFEIWRKVSSSQRDAPSLITHWQDRQWRAGYPDDPNLLRWSYSFDPDSFPSTYYAYIVRDDGDEITALKVLSFQDLLLIFKHKHIYALTFGETDDPYPNWVYDLVDGVGTPSSSSIISYGRKVYFYDYTGFYEFDGTTLQKISWAIEPIIADSINKDYAYLIVGGYFDQHLWWAYPSVSTGTRWSIINRTGNNRILVYNLEDQAWSTVDFNVGAVSSRYVTPASIFVGQVEDDSNGVLIGDSQRGKVYRYGLSYFDNTRSITGTYESPWFDCKDQYDFQKHFKDIQFVMSRGDSTIVYIDYYKDYVNTVIWTDTVAVDTFSHPHYYKRAIQWGNIRGQRIKLRIRATDIDADFSLAFFRLKWKPVGEVRYNDD